jgi:hypothetical protein
MGGTSPHITPRTMSVWVYWTVARERRGVCGATPCVKRDRLCVKEVDEIAALVETAFAV